MEGWGVRRFRQYWCCLISLVLKVQVEAQNRLSLFQVHCEARKVAKEQDNLV